MTWVVPLALGGLAILVMVLFTTLSARKRHKQAHTPAVVVGPRILVHDINDDRCTGCDACVAVCPTNVLDLVSNKSRVLRFEDCIQCEACMFACPTEALVMFPEGAVPPPLKVPEIDENFQTVVPGQYLIGEVAGKPLVKSAANLGRAVVEHMVMTGLRSGAMGPGSVDVAIIGSGPGGLSAALTCIQHKLSYVVLEKEQDVASTIARYPKGKLVMAEPYDTMNLSFLPVFDSAKEQLIPIWKELLERVGMQIRQGESVETVVKGSDGAFDVRTTVAGYRAQRVVMSIGTRGKPRTLQVPGENLPKIFSLLEDPDDWRGKSVLVVGGGDSACEAALALADAGAKVMISYRGKGFNRAAPKNKNAMEQYASEGRLKAKLGSQVLGFEADSVTLALNDGSQKRYPNDGAFVLIGADPPIAWLEKMGVRFVEREHQYQMGKTDDIVRRFVRAPMGCPEDAARAAAQILGGSTGLAPSMPAPPPAMVAAAAAEMGMPMGAEPVSGPRKWLRSATSIFSMKGAKDGGTNPGLKTDGKGKLMPPARKPQLTAPVPLSEFAKRGKTSGDFGTGVHRTHTGDGRRDQLTAGERTRILRMLRDEGGRQADEDSRVYIGAAPGGKDYDFDFDNDSPAPAPVSSSFARPDVPAKPAVVVGIAAAQAKARREKRQSAAPPSRQMPAAMPPGPPSRTVPATAPPPMRQVSATSPPPAGPKSAPLHLPPTTPTPPLHLDASLDSLEEKPTATARGNPPPTRSKPKTNAPPPRRTVPPPFNDEATREVDEQVLASLRDLPKKAGLPKPSKNPTNHFDEPTRMSNIDPRAYDETEHAQQTVFDPKAPAEDEATRMANIATMRPPPPRSKEPSKQRAAAKPPSPTRPTEDRTRAVDIKNDRSISDIDWDLD